MLTFIGVLVVIWAAIKIITKLQGEDQDHDYYS